MSPKKSDAEELKTREQPATTRGGGRRRQKESPGAQTDGPAGSGQNAAEKIPVFLDPATEQGLTELVEKLAPLIQGGRLHNIVDLLSLLSDVVDLADEAMIEKLAANYEQAVSGVWATGNAARYAANKVMQSPTPSLFGLLRAANDKDVRRGLYFLLQIAGVFGRQMRPD